MAQSDPQIFVLRALRVSDINRAKKSRDEWFRFFRWITTL